jgi:hypothetical protein
MMRTKSYVDMNQQPMKQKLSPRFKANNQQPMKKKLSPRFKANN